jgi:hypothetical protein
MENMYLINICDVLSESHLFLAPELVNVTRGVFSGQ